jgi:hypothetical protein
MGGFKRLMAASLVVGAVDLDDGPSAPGMYLRRQLQVQFRGPRSACIKLACIVGVLLAFGVSNAAATEYRCFKAATCNGKDETIDAALVRNESGTGLIGRLWEELFEGYREDGRQTCSGCTELNPATPGFERILGHAETERWYMMFTYTLSGFEYHE